MYRLSVMCLWRRAEGGAEGYRAAAKASPAPPCASALQSAAQLTRGQPSLSRAGRRRPARPLGGGCSRQARRPVALPVRGARRHTAALDARAMPQHKGRPSESPETTGESVSPSHRREAPQARVALLQPRLYGARRHVARRPYGPVRPRGGAVRLGAATGFHHDFSSAWARRLDFTTLSCFCDFRS